MKKVKWDPHLIVNIESLKNALSFWFGDKLIKTKYGVSGLCCSDWVYGQWPVGQEKNFRFAVYLLTGEAVVLFIQSDDTPLTKQWKSLLMDGLRIRLESEGRTLHVEHERFWSRKTDQNFDIGLDSIAWFRPQDPLYYVKAFVDGLIPEYQSLWLKP